MSDAASEEKPEAEAPPFVENDDRETAFTYDKGGVPFYLAILWAGFIVVYVTVMAVVALPDLRAWWSP